MSVSFLSLVFIWLTVTSVKTQNFTSVMTGEVTGHSTPGQTLMHNLSTSDPPIEASGQTIAQPTMADANQTVNTTRTRMLPTKTFTTKTQTTATSTSSTSSPLISTAVSEKSKTEVQFKATKSATVVTSHASNSTTATTVPPEVSSFQNTGKTTTIQFTRDQTTHRPTISAQNTQHISTTTKSITPPDKSAGTSPRSVTMTTTKTTFIYITKEKTTEELQKKINEAQTTKETNHGSIVAGIIGGALILMMVGFLVIFVKKRRFQKQQISTTEWAGPSPFLEGGADNDQTTQRSSKRISLSSFLPQRLSKRLSLLQETDEELQEMTLGTTFGDQPQGCTFGREVDTDDVKKSNGTAVGAQEIKTTGDAPETVENSVSVNASPTNNPHSTNDNSDAANHSEDPANPLAASTADENPLVQQNDDLK